MHIVISYVHTRVGLWLFRDRPDDVNRLQLSVGMRTEYQVAARPAVPP